MNEDKVVCRTPNAAGTTRIPRWKFDAVRSAILAVVDAAGPPGIAFGELSDAVRMRLTSDQLDRLGSVGWHVTSVKLELEVSGEIARVSGVTPHRLVRGFKA